MAIKKDIATKTLDAAKIAINKSRGSLIDASALLNALGQVPNNYTLEDKIAFKNASLQLRYYEDEIRKIVKNLHHR